MHAQPGYVFTGGANVAGTDADQDWVATLYGVVAASKVGPVLTCILASTSPQTTAKEKARAVNGGIQDGGVSGYRCFAKDDGTVWVGDSKGATTRLLTTLIYTLNANFITPRAQGSLDPDLPPVSRQE